MNSFLMFRWNSRLRTGNDSKSLDIVTVVPVWRGHTDLLTISPWSLSSSLVPTWADLCLVTMCIFDRAHSELKASPRKPNVPTSSKSENSRSFDVWYLAAVQNEIIIFLQFHAFARNYGSLTQSAEIALFNTTSIVGYFNRFESLFA